jgi:hypothetical protein
MRRLAALSALALLAAGTQMLPATAQDPPQHGVTAPLAAAPDFATEQFADPWDYNNLADILIDGNGPTTAAVNTRMEGARLIWDATGAGYVSPLWPGYPAALPTGREGAINPINANHYTHASFTLFAERDTPAALMWFAGCRDFTNDCMGGMSFTARQGWNTYNLPLANSFPGLTRAWQGPVFGLRLSFSAGTSTRMEQDWMRVHRPTGDVQVSWSNPGGGSANLVWQREAAPGYARTSGVVAPISGGSGTTAFPASAYPPGTYRFVVESGGQTGAPSDPLVIAAPPLPTVLDPSAAGGEDWAARHTGRGWDFTDPSDAAQLGNVQDVQWTGDALVARNGPPQQNDPFVVLRQPGPIDPDRYHRVTVRMTYEGPFNLAFADGGGTHGRLLWQRADLGESWVDSREIVTYTTVDTYTWSMKTDPPGRISETGVPWTGSPVTKVRWDPNEDEGARRWTLYEVSLRADAETAGSAFDIRWRDADHRPGSTVTLAHHPGGPGAAGVTIASGVEQQAGVNTYRWDAGAVPHGQHWISVTVTDGVNTNRAMSSGPVRVHGGGAPPPAPEPPGPACEGAPSGGFADTAGNAHVANIDCIVWYGITQGLTPTTYGPAQGVTRAQMATFIARTITRAGGDLPTPSDQGFADIDGDVHADAINQLAAAGIVAGTSASTYEPARIVNRAQMASFLVRAYEHLTGETLPEGGPRFTDTAGNVHEANINKAAEAGFAQGTTATTYNPSGDVRRDQMGSFLARVLNRLYERGELERPA